MHGLRIELLEAQAAALGIPLQTIQLSEKATMVEYNQLMEQTITNLKKEGFNYSVFGDIFLEDLRQYRENQLALQDMQGVFPLWKKDTTTLLQEMLEAGFKAIIVCCNARLLDKSFCGRILDEQFLKDLPESVDPCGENGEFHTFCFDGPIFNSPIPFSKGEIIYRSYPAPKNDSNEDQKVGFWYCDLT